MGCTISNNYNKGVYIPQIDGKDIWLAHAGKFNVDKAEGYKITLPDGTPNFKRYSATLPYSLDLIELRKVYESVFRNRRFSFREKNKEFSKYIVSCTFKYSIREYNRIKHLTYVKNGYSYEDVELNDCICCKDGELIAIKIDTKVNNPVSQDILGKNFYYENGCYKIIQNVKTLYSIADVRKELYTNGFWMDGVHYSRWKRSAGSARVGKCLFIADALYNKMHKSDLCGLKIKENDKIDLAGFESYISLTLSSIIGLLEIQPENILLIEDWDSTFKDKVVNVREQDGRLYAKEEEVDITNTIWDGESLIDPSLMGEYSNYGFILLRNKFFKSAAFNFNIQRFFADHNITSIEQLNGKTLATNIEDVKFITTPSSIKYLKFSTFENWIENAGSMFGVVKHEKKTHYMEGECVSAHYQLLNTLQLSKEDVEDFLKPTLDYLHLLKTDPAVMRYHIKFGYGSEEDEDTECLSFSSGSKNDIVYNMLGITDEFARTKLYAGFKNDVIKSFVKNVRCGHVLVDGNYSTLLGNPIEMALSACGLFNGQGTMDIGTIYTKRFPFGKMLLCSRSPHVACGNNLLVTNRYYNDIQRYCNLTDEIVVVNSINENILNRLSGADFDSDTMLITDNQILIDAAKRNYDVFLVPSGSVKSIKKNRRYTNADKCDLDISTSQNLIGEIVNLSQELNTKFWHGINNGMSLEEVKPYYIDAALLDVMSNLAIDAAKREFPVNLKLELKEIKERYQQRDSKGRSIKPGFFGFVAKQKGYYNPQKKNYKTHDTTMDYVQKCILGAKAAESVSYIPFSSILTPTSNRACVIKEDVELVLQTIKDVRTGIKNVWAVSEMVLSQSEKRAITADMQQEAINYIDNIKLTIGTMRMLIEEIEKPENSDVSRTIFYTLFGKPNKSFFKLIMASRTPVARLERVQSDGDIWLYSLNFKRYVL